MTCSNWKYKADCRSTSATAVLQGIDSMPGNVGFTEKRRPQKPKCRIIMGDKPHWAVLSSGFELVVSKLFHPPASEWYNLNERKTTEHLTHCNHAGFQSQETCSFWKENAWHQWLEPAEQHRSVRGVMTNLPTFPMYSSVEGMQCKCWSLSVRSKPSHLVPHFAANYPVLQKSVAATMPKSHPSPISNLSNLQAS